MASCWEESYRTQLWDKLSLVRWAWVLKWIWWSVWSSLYMNAGMKRYTEAQHMREDKRELYRKKNLITLKGNLDDTLSLILILVCDKQTIWKDSNVNVIPLMHRMVNRNPLMSTHLGVVVCKFILFAMYRFTSNWTNLERDYWRD